MKDNILKNLQNELYRQSSRMNDTKFKGTDFYKDTK